MKKTLIVAALTTVFSLSAGQAMAAAGKVEFEGKITGSTCTIVNDSANPLDVTLGEYGANEFSAAGDATVPLKFDIKLTGCPATATKAAVNFGGTSDTTNPDLLKVSGTGTVATGVAIQLYDSARAALALGTPSAANPLTVGDNVLAYYAGYKSTAATVTEGAANGVADFSLIYN